MYVWVYSGSKSRVESRLELERDSGLEPSQNSGVEYNVVEDWNLGVEATVVAVVLNLPSAVTL